MSTRSRAKPWFDIKPAVHLVLVRQMFSWVEGRNHLGGLGLGCGGNLDYLDTLSGIPSANMPPGEFSFDLRMVTCSPCRASLDILLLSALATVQEDQGVARAHVENKAYPFSPQPPFRRLSRRYPEHFGTFVLEADPLDSSAAAVEALNRAGAFFRR